MLWRVLRTRMQFGMSHSHEQTLIRMSKCSFTCAYTHSHTYTLLCMPIHQSESSSHTYACRIEPSARTYRECTYTHAGKCKTSKYIYVNIYTTVPAGLRETLTASVSIYIYILMSRLEKRVEMRVSHVVRSYTNVLILILSNRNVDGLLS
jgi:hypothetical protein